MRRHAAGAVTTTDSRTSGDLSATNLGDQSALPGQAVDAPAAGAPKPAVTTWARPGVVGPVVLVVVGGAAAIDALTLGLWTEVGPGPGFFPLALGVLLVALSLIWLAQDWRTPATEREEAYGDPLHGKHLVVVLGSLVAMAVLLVPLGFQLSMAGFLLFHLRRGTTQRWPMSVLIAVVTSVAVFHGFNDGLNVPLPLSQITVLFRAGI